MQTVRTASAVALMVTTLALFVGGCSDHTLADLEQYVSAEKAKKAGRIRPVPEFKAYDSYVYTVDENSRSPFDPIQQEELISEQNQSIGALSPDADRHKESLELFPLDTLRYVGSLEQDGKIWAIIISPDSLIHKIQVGNYIGMNYGKVINITDSKLDISELVTNALGGWLERQAGLSLIE